MQRDVRDALASTFDDYRIVRQIHDVPPHEVYEVEVDGRRAVLKRDTGPRGTAATEGRVTAFVWYRTAVPVPEVLHVGPDHYVAAWHPDAPAPDEGDPADETWARAAGRGLATLHDETARFLDGYGYFRAVGDDGSPGDGATVVDRRDDWPALVLDGHDDWTGAAVAYVRYHRPVLADHGHGDVADAVVDFLRERPELLDGAGDPACCHGWATPEHLRVVDGEVACLLDFEHAIAAPGEFDYWRTAVPAFGPDDDGPRRAFRAGYESVRPLPGGFEERRTIYEVLNLVYYFESLYVQDQHGPEETAERASGLADAVRERLADLR